MNSPEKIPSFSIALKDLIESGHIPDPNKLIQITFTLPEPDLPKLHAFMHSDQFEKAEELRKAKMAEWTKSLEHVVKYASHEYGSGATVFAQFLASLYNGNRVKADVSGLRSLDGRNFEHMMNVIRLCYMAGREPHDFFKNGNDIFEFIIKRHKLEKRRKS